MDPPVADSFVGVDAVVGKNRRYSLPVLGWVQGLSVRWGIILHPQCFKPEDHVFMAQRPPDGENALGGAIEHNRRRVYDCAPIWHLHQSHRFAGSGSLV